MSVSALSSRYRPKYYAVSRTFATLRGDDGTESGKKRCYGPAVRRRGSQESAGSDVNLAVLASGTGSILEALIEAGLPIKLVLVDRPCRAEEVARAAGIPLARVIRTSFGPGFDRDAYTAEVVEALESNGVELVAMAGYGTVLGAEVHEKFPGRIVNTHPALLPKFKGWHAVEAALEASVDETGCTVHLATLEVDEGPILAQERVPVLPGDTAESLHERIKEVERRIYPAALWSLIAGMRTTTGSSERGTA
jgi:phosphoribosylglycinamide formyltransferase-1